MINKIIECKDYLCAMYPSSSIIGIFQFKEEYSKKEKLKVIYNPSIEDICLSNYFFYKTFEIKDGTINIILEDVRNFNKELKEFNYEYIKLLFTNECWINQLYQNEWNEYYLKFKDSLDKMNNTELIDNATISIVKRHLSYDRELEIRLEDFLNKLTHAEEYCLKLIIKKIGKEGTFSVTKLLKEDPTISRAVYINLLNKLKENNIALVEGKGVKGTYVNFIHSGLRLKISEGYFNNN